MITDFAHRERLNRVRINKGELDFLFLILSVQISHLRDFLLPAVSIDVLSFSGHDSFLSVYEAKLIFPMLGH